MLADFQNPDWMRPSPHVDTLIKQQLIDVLQDGESQLTYINAFREDSVRGGLLFQLFGVDILGRESVAGKLFVERYNEM